MSRKTRILMVDDNVSFLEIFSTILSAEGYEVCVAATGNDGLQMARTRHPDLVLLDVVMPGKSGIEVCREIKADPDLVDVFVVLISGEATSPAQTVGGLETGADEYLVKPLGPAEFLARVRTIIRLRDTTAALRSSEQHYRRLIDVLPDAFTLIDLKYHVVQVNSRAVAMLGYADAKELVGRSAFEMVHASERERFQALLADILKTHARRSAEYTFTGRNADCLPVELTAAVSAGPQGEDAGWLTVIRDITHRKQAEDALRESEARKTATLQASLDAIIMIDGRGRIVEFNFAAEKMFGYPRERTMGRALPNLILPRSMQHWFRTGLARGFSADKGPVLGARISLQALRADGVGFPVEFTITRNELAGPPMFTAFIRDISARKRTEAKLAMLAHAVQSTREPIMITNVAEHCMFVNHAFRSAYGYRDAEILGRHLTEVLSARNPRSKIAEVLRQTRRGGWQGELVALRKDGTDFPILMRTSHIKNDAGATIGLMSAMQDITERRRAEERIRLLADAVQSAQELICITDEENVFTFVNDAFLAAYGYRRDEIIGCTPEFLHSPNNPPGLCALILRETLAHGWKGELINRRKDGKEFPIALSTSRITSAEGRTLGLVGVARDISERMRVEEEFRRLPQRILAAQEAERSRVARELHDGVNQLIASAKMRLRKVEELLVTPNPAAKMILARCHEMLVRALEENRRIAHDLRPGDLDELGLGEACRNACRELQSRSKLVVKCRIARNLGRMPLRAEINLFRILQEALTNIEKHARAKCIQVRIGVAKSFIELRIKDDGRGFGTKSKAEKGIKSGLGLTHMRERAVSLGGSCQMDSSAKGGTTISVRVPREFEA